MILIFINGSDGLIKITFFWLKLNEGVSTMSPIKETVLLVVST